MKIAARPAPPADFRPPEFDDTGETRFEQQIFTQIEQQFGIPGGNPYAWNIAAEDAKLPEIFNQFFAGQVVWADRDKLDRDQAAQWDQVIKRWHVHLNDVQQRATAFYDHMMGKWKGMRTRHEQTLAKFREERRKPPIEKVMVNEKGEETIHRWDADAKPPQWVDSGRRAKLSEGEKEKKESDFRWAYGIWKKNNPKGTPDQFRRIWEKPTGELSESAIIESITDLALMSEDPDYAAKTYNRYIEHRKKFGRREALNKALQESETAILPEGLTEEHIKFYEKEHGWDREETIRKYRMKKGL